MLGLIESKNQTSANDILSRQVGWKGHYRRFSMLRAGGFGLGVLET